MLPAITEDPLFHLLTPRQQMFVQHPDVLKNAVAAAIAVGYSESYAQARAYLLRNQLMYYIRPLQERKLAAAGITVERVRDELGLIAFANITDYFENVDIGGETRAVWKDPKLLPEHLQRAIKKIEYEEIVDAEGKSYQVIRTIELVDKLAGLRELEEILGLKDARLRAPQGNIQEEDAELLAHLDDNELEQVTRLYEQAERRARQLMNQRRDQKAIPGTAKKVEK